MNKAESGRIADYLELLGYDSAPTPYKADLIVLNTCVVRQSAENKVLGMLSYLKGIKRDNPYLPILVTGCFVNSASEELERRFSHVDLFFRPGDYQTLYNWAKEQRISLPRKRLKLPQSNNIGITAFVPIIQGCNNFCSYCIVPYRRGREKSRPLEEIVNEAAGLVNNGVKEITLLGQNVNSYGHDLPAHPDLSELLKILNGIDGITRIRFLTNHPKDMNLKLIESIAYLDKVCEHITLPLQSGDDAILKTMRRDYTAEQYYRLVNIIRSHIPRVALCTDIIVGFPGETDEQFTHTLGLIEKIRFDAVHIAAYSPRQGTIASKEFEDNISAEIKKGRLETIESTQSQIAGDINAQLQGNAVEVLVEGKKKNKWYGRTRSDKLAFFEEEGNCSGQMVNVVINKTSPWSLQGKVKSQ
jgi:tRNA-2-methylthio-N6-dimethylallyladenosine synthase